MICKNLISLCMLNVWMRIHHNYYNSCLLLGILEIIDTYVLKANSNQDVKAQFNLSEFVSNNQLEIEDHDIDETSFLKSINYLSNSLDSN